MSAETGSAMLAQGREVLSRQAFSRLLQAQLDAFSPGQAQLRMPVRPDLLQQNGLVHGGVLSYLADNALTFAAGSVLGDCITSEYKINYLRPARDFDVLIAVASVAGSGRTQAVCRCDIYGSKGDERKLCAIAQGTIRKAA